MPVSFRATHPFDRFGPANWVTAVRALLVAAVASALVFPASRSLALATAVTAAVTTVLDGVDGWLARRTRLASAFGARFDMEVDAALILALSLVVYRDEKAGIWVLASGLMRYAFVAAAAVLPWMRRPVPQSMRAKSVCVVQVVGLIAVVYPGVTKPASTLIAGAALAALCYSFFVDTLWLWDHRAEGAPRDRQWLYLVFGLLILNASLTFDNIWPTPAFWWTGRASIELAAWIAIVAAIRGRRGPMPAWSLSLVGGVWVLLTFARYVEVTAPALYGRDINLYWDLRFVPDVAAMITRVAPVWLIALATTVAIAVLALIHRLLLWALRRVDEGAASANGRRTLAIAAVAIVAVFVVDRAAGRLPEDRFAPTPVLHTYTHQIALVLEARTGSAKVPNSPPIESTFAQVRGADVFLVFVESYGAVTDEPTFAARLAPARRQFEADIRDTGRQVASAYVESPTFGGSSWLAHISLISGIEVRDPDTNALLMTQPRDTLVKAFKRAGFRTIGLMPGLRQQWPEGGFYGFDEIYGADRLAYGGPEFGWFAIPDQFALARFDVLETNRPAAPRFVFFPTISTHFPFSPTPPYQPDWPRMLTAHPWTAPEIVHAYAGEPNWTDFGPGYVTAMSYDFAVLGGYLRQHAGRDIVMIVIGDHQPPAAVSGEHATWNVPVHVVTSRQAILDRLRAAGFRDGLTPERRALSRMHALQPILLNGFGT